MSKLIEQIMFRAMTRPVKLSFATASEARDFRRRLYAVKARLAKHFKRIARLAGEPSPDPALWCGTLLTTFSDPTTLRLYPETQKALGIDRIRKG